MAWIKCYQKIEVGMIDSARICGNVHQKSSRRGNYTLISGFCLGLGTLPLVSPLD